MALNIVELPYSYFPDFNRGRPLFNADIYVGNVDTDPEIPANQKQVTVRQEDGTEVQIAQPVKTSAGGVPTYNGSPVTVLVDGPYSIKVLDKLGADEYYSPDVTKGVPLTPETLPTYTDPLIDSVTSGSVTNPVSAGSLVSVGVNALYTDNGTNVVIIYWWDNGSDFPGSQHVISSITANSQNGFDVVTDQGTFEFVTSDVRNLREIHNTDGWGIFDDGLDKSSNVEAMLSYSGFNEVTWHSRAKCNNADYGEFLNIKFTGDGEVYTDLVSTTNPDGSLNTVGACFRSTTAKRIRARFMRASGANGVDSAISIFCDSASLERCDIAYSEQTDIGHYIKGGINSVARSGDNEFRSSVTDGSDAGRNGAIAFEHISVGGEDYAAQDEPRTRTGRLFVKYNDFKVYCSDGSNKDVAKYTGLCEAPQIVNNIFHNFNKNAEAEVDTFTASYRGKINNDHKNCSLKVQTILGALSSQTTSAPLSEFTRIGGSFKFEPQSVNTFGIVARGGYFLIENYVIDWKRDTATTNFSAVNVRSSDVSYYNGNGTVDAVNYRIGSGIIDLRCPNYAGFSISPFNEFTSKENYNIDGPIVLGGNGNVINGIKNGTYSNCKIYYGDDYNTLSVTGDNLYAEGNLMINADGTPKIAAYGKSTQKNNFMDSVATSVNVSTLVGGVLDVSDTGDVIDLTGTGTISSIVGGFRSGRIALRLSSGTTTIVDGTSTIVTSGGVDIVMNSSRNMIVLERLTPSGIWYQVGGTV